MEANRLFSRLGRIFALAAIMSAAFPVAGLAQEKIVSGIIKDKATGKPIDISSVSVTVYAFNTVSQAQDVANLMKSDANTFVVTHTGQAYPDRTGYYEIKVAPTGALLYVAEMADPVLEKVNERMEINVTLDVGLRITEAILTEERDEVAVLEARTEIVGNILSVSSSISLPSFTGRPDARLIVQPVLMDRATRDTLRYLRPMVVDGKEYTQTQKSRLNYQLSNDPLYKYLEEEQNLTEEKLTVPWSANIYVRDPNKEFLVLGLIQLEDYNWPFFYMEEYLASIRARRPLRFLKYDIAALDLDPDDYYVAPRREKMSSAGSVSLQFELNQASLSPNDTVGRHQLDSLKAAVMDIVNGEGTALQEFHIIGTASPEGRSESNAKLAKKRTEFALNEIISVLPKYNRDRIWSTAESVIRPWSDVAEMMEAEDSASVQAAEIRDIIARYPKDIDSQGLMIKRLPYYQEIKDKYLPRLRSVRYTLSYEVNRALTPQEILHRWKTDENYRSGRRSFTLHEYWQLFKLVKDETELDTLYHRAYRESKAQGRPWELAAGKLASSYLKKDIVDTTILSPFIDYTVHNTDVSITRMDGNGADIINPKALVYNQLVMFMKSLNFSRSSQLSQILPDTEELREAKSLAMCLGGYYKGGDTSEERERINGYFNTVCNISLWNKVVLCLARGLDEKVYNDEALRCIEELPDEEPKKYYFKAIALSRKGYDYLMESEGNLYKACKMDSSLIEIAKGDGDIREDSMEEVLKALEDPETGDMIYGFY